MHRVEDGERLSAIAQRYGIGVDDMVRANPAKPRLQTIGGAVFETLSVGELLAVPAPLGAAEVPNPPRVFLEDALQEVTEANQGSVTFATKRTKLGVRALSDAHRSQGRSSGSGRAESTIGNIPRKPSCV